MKWGKENSHFVKGKIEAERSQFNKVTWVVNDMTSIFAKVNFSAQAPISSYTLSSLPFLPPPYTYTHILIYV